MHDSLQNPVGHMNFLIYKNHMSLWESSVVVLHAFIIYIQLHYLWYLVLTTLVLIKCYKFLELMNIFTNHVYTNSCV
jgi:hypothetical protein